MRLSFSVMAICEICGERPVVKRARIEGAALEVCEKCGRGGVELPRLPTVSSPRQAQVESFESEPVVVADFAKRIREARERKGLTQVELASALREKESLVARTERGIKPPATFAKKLEKFFSISLLENYEEEQKPPTTSGEDNLTFGDVLKVK